MTRDRQTGGPHAGPLPTFLIAGASRSGTSSLHHLLGQHPDIFVPPTQKELRFFDRVSEFDRGLSHYRAWFEAWRGERAVGEASPPYFYHGINFDANGRICYSPSQDPPARVIETLPHAKIVLTLRNPVDRALSQYLKARRNGIEAATSFRGALQSELNGDRDPRYTGLCWIYKNRYGTHVPHWMSLCASNQVKIMIFEKWTRDVGEATRELYAFLGVRRDFVPKKRRPKNRAKGLGKHMALGLQHTCLGRLAPARRVIQRAAATGGLSVDDATRRWAAEIFEPDIRAVEDLLGTNLDVWRA